MTPHELRRGPACPSSDALLGPDSDSIRTHLAGCAACRAELELLRAFEAAQPSNTERADLDWMEARLRQERPGLERTRKWWQVPMTPRLALVPAALLIAVAVGVQWNQSRVRPLDESGNATTVLRAGSNLEWSGVPSGEIAALPDRLDWTPAGDSSYVVELLEVDGTVVWKSTAVTSPALNVPPELRTVAGPRRNWAWRVRAYDAGGRMVAESPRLSFRVAAPAKP